MNRPPSAHTQYGRVVRGVGFSLAAVTLCGCASVGPDFVKPDADAAPSWTGVPREEIRFEPQDRVEWWQLFDDPVLERLVASAFDNNNNLRVAGLRVLEARAQLGIAVGNQYPQSQLMVGDIAALQASKSNANTAGGGDLNFTQYDLAATASWEIDFWGRFRRGIEAADANLLATVASFDDVLVLLAAQVADSYTVMRTAEEQLRISRDNVARQERSFDIATVMYKFGASNELDVQQAETQLLSTRASIPELEITLRQSRNALATLLGMPPGGIDAMLPGTEAIPDPPATIRVGVPADMLRQRPDVRRAELVAAAQSARVGVASANLYPSFSISGSIGLSAAGSTHTSLSGGNGFEDLFQSDSLAYSIGPSFVWPFLNYDRIKNSIRIEDARLQQALLQYRETVIQAAREVEDAMAAYAGAQAQDEILRQAVISAKRSNELSMLRYTEGFADYQRVLEAQRQLFSQQQRYVGNRGFAIRSLIALYRALGGGWQTHTGYYIDDATRETMRERVDWGDLLETDRANTTGDSGIEE